VCFACISTIGRIVRVICDIKNRFFLAVLWDSDTNGARVKSKINWALFFLILAIGLSSAFGQAQPQLICDPISASKTKCGFDAYDGSPGKYLAETVVSTEDDPPCCVGTETHDAAFTKFYSGTDHYDALTCLHSLSGSGSFTRTFCDAHTESGTAGPFSDPPYTINSATNKSWDRTRDCGYDPTCPGLTCHQHQDATLSNEYTTEMLISNTVAALPPYPGTFTGACSAYRNLSSDETSYSIQRFKYKFTFATATQPFTIYWVERFTPAGNGVTE
jgi:hypothetical protein